MATFAEFYQPEKKFIAGAWTDTGELMRGVGETATCRMHGNLLIDKAHDIAQHEGRARGYVAYRLYTGTPRNPEYLTEIIPISKPEDNPTA